MPRSGEAAVGDRRPSGGPAVVLVILLVMMVMLSVDLRARGGQLGALVSPGPLSRPHAQLEGIRNCQSCHEPGRRVTAERCLACHKPIAQRMAATKGVHRNVVQDCVTCHVEHMGTGAELRPFDTRAFNHAAETGYVLNGKHQSLAADCGACHKTRSFLTVTPACGSCHVDPHKGVLGPSCERCHTTATAFKDTRTAFDHSKTTFPLLGAHRAVTCTACHTNQVYSGVAFAQCRDCHKDPHTRRLGATCESCHTSDTWRTTRVDHERTDFALLGKHVAVACVKCHLQPAMRVKPKAELCAACHVDPHRGSFKQDCRGCHSERSFKDAPFDHATTRFPLGGKHAPVSCEKCHPDSPRDRARGASPVVDFRGLKSECVACHADVHEDELGRACQTCHGDQTFKLAAYTHARVPEFFGGQHASVTCDGCHKPMLPNRPVRTGAAMLQVRFKAAITTCVTCHEDVHLGQVGAACERCHSVEEPKFAVDGFSHQQTKLPLTGKHETTECRACHKPETALFPSAAGTAVRLTGIATTCAPCHADVHLGQLPETCDTCHSTATFRLTGYAHRNRMLAGFFVGPHAAARCDQCHKPQSARFPAGEGTAVHYALDARCVTCHEDAHRGQLGDRCIDCHKLTDRSARGELGRPGVHAQLTASRAAERPEGTRQ